jgi:DNA-binding MarR family transcriptional regulator
MLVLLRRARAGYDSVAAKVHPALDAAAYGILSLIESGTASTVTALAERLSVGKPTISRQVSALESLGLVLREPSAEDRRAMDLRLTDEGRARLTAARLRSKEQFRALLKEWPIEDVETLADLLSRFNRLS